VWLDGSVNRLRRRFSGIEYWNRRQRRNGNHRDAGQLHTHDYGDQWRDPPIVDRNAYCAVILDASHQERGWLLIEASPLFLKFLTQREKPVSHNVLVYRLSAKSVSVLIRGSRGSGYAANQRYSIVCRFARRSRHNKEEDLIHLPLDQLKIDRSFVDEIREDSTSGPLHRQSKSLSNAMNFPVIAESCRLKPSVTI
jgi:hypothetical protein